MSQCYWESSEVAYYARSDHKQAANMKTLKL